MSNTLPAIAVAVQRGSTIFVYDEKGRHTANIQAGDGLQGYTSGTVNVLRGRMLMTYDGRGRHLNTTLAR
jgi:hypothetical protein